jgi:hypothetical protein
MYRNQVGGSDLGGFGFGLRFHLVDGFIEGFERVNVDG